MMKKIVYAALLCSLASCGNDKTQEADKSLMSTDIVSNPNSAMGVDSVAFDRKPTMDFADTTYDFGTIREGETVEHEFTFVNNGKTPLIVSGANGSCGCTAANPPTEPIAPGKGSNIKVKFNSTGKEGHQEKTVLLTTNSTRGSHTLYITAEVQAAGNQ